MKKTSFFCSVEKTSFFCSVEKTSFFAVQNLVLSIEISFFGSAKKKLNF